jgi:hypothetical protein
MTKYTYEMTADGYLILQKGKTVAPARVCQVLNTKWSRTARQLRPQQNSIILVVRPKTQPEEEFASALQELADEILARLAITCLLIGVEKLADFHHISEDDMNAAGWVRAEKVLAYMDDAFEKLAGDEEEE